MSIIITLILISLVVALGFLAAFFWATKHGQFDDGFTPAVRILFDDAPKIQPETNLHPNDTITSSPEVSGLAIPTISTKEDE